MKESDRALELLAPAKLNLGLRVLAREASGYHQIETLLIRVGLADRVAIAVRDALGVEARGSTADAEGTVLDGGRLHLSVLGDDGGADPESNLVTRAVTAFRAASGWDEPVSIRLEKRIPVGAGLGGGSSDAAATLVGLNRLAGHPLKPPRLAGLAGELGSDVPFFLVDTGFAWAWGRGTRLLGLEPPPVRPVLIACPHVRVSTVEAYGALRIGEAHDAGVRLMHPGSTATWDGIAALAGNDFEASVHRAHPPLAALSTVLEGTGAIVSGMTGSGSAHFAVFADEVGRAGGVERLRAWRKGLRIEETWTVGGPGQRVDTPGDLR